jgi:hypothetical protein
MPCPRCRKPRTYNDRHDAYYCAACDVWLDEGCRDPTCDYCATRPEKPSLAKRDQDWEEEPDAP